MVDGEIYATLNTSGEEIIKMPENPTKDDYDFDGWYWDKDTWQTPFTANSAFRRPLSSDMNVYCKWKPKTVRVSGISLNKSEVSLRIDETEILTATITPANATDTSVLWKSSNASAVAPVFTRTGYTFIGWDKNFSSVNSNIISLFLLSPFLFCFT